MKHLEEYRSGAFVRGALKTLRQRVRNRWTIMEICGGQTHSLVRSGLARMLPEEITMVHGPGCPVCVTPLEVIDRALAIAARPEVIFTTYGDMLRVPGSHTDLFGVRAAGGDVRIVYSPLDALTIARAHPERQVVFLAIGFETTAPANAMAVHQAHRLGLDNFSVLVSHACVPGAMRALLADPQNRVQAILAAGHVCAVMGWEEYLPIAEEFRVPIVVTGFEPADLMRGLLEAVDQLEQGRFEVANAYERAVRRSGNTGARALIDEVFELCDRTWRGIGVLPASGLKLRPRWTPFDAEQRFEVGAIVTRESAECMAGEILQGRRRPIECPAFATRCTPTTPLGATMVSGEGACAAYYRYRRHD